MTVYTQTSVYVDYVSHLNVSKDSSNEKLAQLSKFERGTVGVAKQRAAIKSSLKTIENNLKKALEPGNFSCFTFLQVVNMLSLTNDWVWTEKELELMKLKTVSYEGAGEKSLRHRFGLPQLTSLDSCDLPDGEVKYIGDDISSFRVGKTGRRLYVRSLCTLDNDLLSDVLIDGEVSANKFYNGIPEFVRTQLLNDLSCDKVMVTYPSLFLTTDTGFIHVKQEDYIHALKLEGITQMGPKYKLRREYVETQLRKTLLPNQHTNVAA